MTPTHNTMREVPACAMRVFSPDAVQLGSNGPDAKTAPLKMTLLSGSVLSSFYWGRCIHDLSGMTVPSRIPMDYEHGNPIGYLNRFNVADNKLLAEGALTPVTEESRNCMALLQAGVPFQASVDFTPSLPADLVVEDVGENEECECNGQKFIGPITVFRKWKLRAAAVCKSGQDSGTESTLQSAAVGDSKIKVTVMTAQKEAPMPSKTPVVAEKPVETVVAQPPAAATVATVKATAEGKPDVVVPPVVEQPVAPAPVEAATTLAAEGENPVESDPRAEFKAFVGEFGADKAAAYYADGLTIEQAREKFNLSVREDRDALAKENAELKAKLAEKQTVAAAPFDQSVPPQGDLWAQYHKINDGAERTKFYRAHRAEMEASR